MSLRKAINSKCKECCYDSKSGLGGWRMQVQGCPCTSCPLYRVRPKIVAKRALSQLERPLVSRKYSKAKGRGGDSGHLGLPKVVIRHSNFSMLSAYANKLLIDLGEQYQGYNNGDLCATWKFMKERGWKSRETLNNSLRELEYFGLVVQTQEGGLNRPSLYAFTWKKIDKVAKESPWNVGEVPASWKVVREPFIKPSVVSRQKKQHRIACQPDTCDGSVH